MKTINKFCVAKARAAGSYQADAFQGTRQRIGLSTDASTMIHGNTMAAAGSAVKVIMIGGAGDWWLTQDYLTSQYGTARASKETRSANVSYYPRLNI